MSAVAEVAYEVTATYDCRVYNGSAYCDYTGRTRYRVVHATSTQHAENMVRDDLLAQQPIGSGERVTRVTSAVAQPAEDSQDSGPSDPGCGARSSAGLLAR